MKKVNGRVMSFAAGSLRKKACGVAVAQSDGMSDTLSVVRPTAKQAIAAANRLMKKLGWELKAPWERLP